MNFGKIYICDDHLVCRVGVESALRQVFPQSQIDFYHGSRAQDVLDFINANKADIYILDLILPDMPGLELIKRIKDRGITAPILVLSVCENSMVISQVLNQGVKGFLSKSHTKEELRAAFVALSQGAEFIDAHTRSVLSAGGLKDFTPREFEVLELLTKGNTNREVAEILGCSVETVKTHRSNILRKAGVRNTAELTAWYLEGNSQSYSRAFPKT